MTTSSVLNLHIWGAALATSETVTFVEVSWLSHVFPCAGRVDALMGKAYVTHAAIAAPRGACCLWLSADGGSMSNAWCNTSVRAYLSVTKTHPRLSGGCIGGWRFLTTASADLWGTWLLLKPRFWSDHVFDILISRSSLADIMTCTVASSERERETKCWWNAAMRRWN